MKLLKWLTSKKYRFFLKKVHDVQRSIWEHEFKVAKSRQLREGIRLDRDHAVETMVNIDKALKEEKDETKKKLAEEERAKVQDNIRRYEAQMKMVDNQINGVPASGDSPGENGLMDTMKSLAELREMYKSHLKDI